MDEQLDLESWTRKLCAPLAGRRVIVPFMVLAATTRTVDQLARWGAGRPLVLARGRGTGPTPDPAHADIEMLDLPGTATTSMTDDVREQARLFRNLPDQVREIVERYDPEREALWLVSPFGPARELLGRPVLGGRPDPWGGLEDKMLCDQIFDAAGVPRAPSRVVGVDLDACLTAAAELDQGSGTVWGGDAREGLNGGADYVRWVRTPAHARAAADFFAEHCDRVRVMPYLDGVPCSIHGFCLADGVAAFRPVELVTFADRVRGRFVFSGMATWWDPPPDAREQMRAVARAVGSDLLSRVDFRGGFSVDGVLTSDGFRPTEVNPRFSGGLTAIARGIDEIPLELLQLVVVAGHEPGIDAATLERLVTRAADERRHAGLVAVSTDVRLTESEEVAFAWLDGEAVAGREATDLVITGGPAGFAGSFFRVVPAEHLCTRGASLRPVQAAALRAIDRRWGTAFGSLT